MLCVGLAGPSATGAELAELRELGPGGFILFKRNVSTPSATRALVSAVRAAIGGTAPALACVDQEGGRVARLAFDELELPSMMALGAAGDEDLAYRAGALLAYQLRLAGLNVNFAPVLDLALEPRNTVIGTRSLGDDPERAATLGSALVRGLQAGGCAATVKHFPGHGATAGDSHRELPQVTASAATLRSRELRPFMAAFAAGARALMSAHVVATGLDAAQPATLSPYVLTELLRRELGFAGVCFTDCLEMEAIAGEAGTANGAARALAAGADCLLVSHDLARVRAARDALVAAVTSGSVSAARLEEAAARVAALRAALASPVPANAEDEAARHAETAREIARRAVCLVRGDAGLDLAKPVTVISFEGAGVSDGAAALHGARPSLSLALRRRRMRSELMRVALAPDAEMRAMLLDVVRTQGERNVVIVTRRAHLYSEQAQSVDALLEAAPAAVVVSALEPFDVPALVRARNILCSFGDEAPNFEAVAGVLTGSARAPGIMPVSLEPAHS